MTAGRPVNPGHDPTLLHNVITELQDLRDRGGFVPEADVDAVWVLSAPGTYDHSPSELGIDAGVYSSVSFDRANIDAGIAAVRAVTALRVGKPVEEVTRDDVEEHGPILFYNGEDENTDKVMYLQNEALLAAAEDPAFPIPQSKLVVDTIPTISTRPQVSGFAEWCREVVAAGGVAPQKVAVVSLFGHSARVGRYIDLEQSQGSFPEGMEFVSAPVSEGALALGAVAREAKRIMQYADMGHLSRNSVFARRPVVAETVAPAEAVDVPDRELVEARERGSFSFRPDDLRREFNVDPTTLRGQLVMTIGERAADESLFSATGAAPYSFVTNRMNADDLVTFGSAFNRIFIHHRGVYGETEQGVADYYREIGRMLAAGGEARIDLTSPGDMNWLLQLRSPRGWRLWRRGATLGEQLAAQGVQVTEEVAENSLWQIPLRDDRSGMVYDRVQPRVIVFRKAPREART